PHILPTPCPSPSSPPRRSASKWAINSLTVHSDSVGRSVVLSIASSVVRGEGGEEGGVGEGGSGFVFRESRIVFGTNGNERTTAVVGSRRSRRKRHAMRGTPTN